MPVDTIQANINSCDSSSWYTFIYQIDILVKYNRIFDMPEDNDFAERTDNQFNFVWDNDHSVYDHRSQIYLCINFDNGIVVHNYNEIC